MAEEKKISSEEYERYLSFRKREENAKKYAERLRVKNSLLIQKAVKAGIKVSDAEVDEALKRK